MIKKTVIVTAIVFSMAFPVYAHDIPKAWNLDSIHENRNFESLRDQVVTAIKDTVSSHWNRKYVVIAIEGYSDETLGKLFKDLMNQGYDLRILISGSLKVSWENEQRMKILRNYYDAKDSSE